VTVNISRTDDVERFTRTISLVGNLDEEQAARLLKISNKCPVHKALIGTIEIDTQLVP
jgi:putative redox protein